MKDVLKIEKGVPVPVMANGQRRARYPWADMKIGESVFFPRDRFEYSNVRSAATLWCIRHPDFKFQTHRNPEGVRVWRIKV